MDWVIRGPWVTADGYAFIAVIPQRRDAEPLESVLMRTRYTRGRQA